MNVKEEQKGAHTIVRISGTLALGEATKNLQERFEKIAETPGSALILEMSGLEHLDSIFQTFPTIEAAVKVADQPGEESTREH